MSSKPITISEKYPSYWEYKGQPQLLLGGSVEDNLFQIAELEEHLDQLQSVGGNYVRCTMSSRDPGDVWPFAERPDGFDLNTPSDEYWARFSRFLEQTWQRDIIVQIELWDRFDFSREPWQQNPYNPHRNTSYTEDESGLAIRFDSHPAANENRFFYTVPALDNNQVVLPYQQAQVDRLLSISLEYPHVLYCIDNETEGAEAWSSYWADWIRAAAAQRRVEVHTTEMWDPKDLRDPMHRRTFDHPERYTFCDVSQNNHQVGQTHWENGQTVRQHVDSVKKRPLNNVKVYGADSYHYGSDQDGMERFWRNLFGKMASVRFHRPPAGLGLSPKAQACIRSARLLFELLDVFEGEPQNNLIQKREANQGYCFGTLGRRLAVFLPQPTALVLDVSGLSGTLRIVWLDILKSQWRDEEIVKRADTVHLRAPCSSLQVALVENEDNNSVSR